MAKKEKTHYRCQACDYIQVKWSGRCPQCEAWNTLEEERVLPQNGHSSQHSGSGQGKCLDLASVTIDEKIRLSSGFQEVDQVLGGGIVSGSAMLLGGEPGIGKSTLLLQIAHHFVQHGSVLYISGEESANQVKMRANRLNLHASMQIYVGSDLDGVLESVRQFKPDFLIVDSVQTLYDVELGLTPGTVNQIKRCVHEIISYIKQHDIALFLVAHVTKDGMIAGPKAIEHLVDTVLYFEAGDHDLRLLRAVKNRFGAVDELGVFTMTHLGLVEMSLEFYQQFSPKESTIGSSMVAVLEGSRIFFHEIQALTIHSKGNFSRIYSEHIDSQRVARISAILEKYLNLGFSEHDIYINVSGGVKLYESSIDLAIALALYSARLNILLPHTLVACGELTLAGGVRWARQTSKRMKVAEEFHFMHFAGAKLITLPNSDNIVDNEQYSLIELIRGIALLGKG